MILDTLVWPGILVSMCLVISGACILIFGIALWAEDRGYSL